MLRALLFLALFPAIVSAQDTYLGLRFGRNVAQLPDGGTRSGPAIGVFTQVDISDHLGVGWDVGWMRSAVLDSVQPWRSEMWSVARPEYVTTDLVARLSSSHSFDLSSPTTVGVTLSGGGWLGARTGGQFVVAHPTTFDFGHVWGVSFFVARGALKLEASMRAYHGEREVWKGGFQQRGAPALIGIAYRVR